MTNQASRIRSCLAPFHAIAMLSALGGCNLDTCDRHPIAEKLCANRRHAECAPCPSFHTTEWQPWQEGPMAVRCGDGAMMGTVRVRRLPNDETLPLLPGDSRSPSEMIPVPEGEKRNEPTKPRGVTALPDDPRPKRGTASGALQVPTQFKEPEPAGKDALPAQEKPADKPIDNPPLPPALSSDQATEPIIIASWVTDSRSSLVNVRPITGSETPAEPSDAFPASSFTHRRSPQATSSD